jgi:virulence factor Mce-like protein
MPNIFDGDPRGPSQSRLLVLGVMFVVIASTVAGLLMAESRGQFDRRVRVTASLLSVGDGLPAKSDVKFRGILVGSVDDVEPAAFGERNVVHISLKREFAETIPDTVTARVVPSNAFAVSSVQLVDNGPSEPLRPGAVISEDTRVPTVLFQTTLNKVRQLLRAVGRPESDGVGPVTALGEATEGRGPKLREAVGNLNEIVAEINTVVGPEGDTQATTLAAAAAAIDGLQNVSPRLYDALDNAIRPARTLAEKKVAVTDLISAGLSTAADTREAFDNHTDRLINITTQLSPPLGVLADNAHQFLPIARRIQNLGEKMWSVWDPRTNNIQSKTILSLTPVRQYVRADCPRYGELLGPSCFTAPEVPTAPDLHPALESMGYPPAPGLPENRPNLAPPRDSVGSIGRFFDPPPAAEEQAVPPPVSTQPVDPPSPGEPERISGDEAIGQLSATVGGIGPAGGPEEKAQLSRILGVEADAGTVLMAGPLFRGTTVHLATEPGSDP